MQGFVKFVLQNSWQKMKGNHKEKQRNVWCKPRVIYKSIYLNLGTWFVPSEKQNKNECSVWKNFMPWCFTGHEHFRDSQMSASSSDPMAAAMGINLFAQYLWECPLLPVSLAENDFLEGSPRETACNKGLLLSRSNMISILKAVAKVLKDTQSGRLSQKISTEISNSSNWTIM